MKRYVSHKEVDAAKIDHLLVGEGDALDQVTVVTEDKETIEVGRDWFNKHSENQSKVLSGGYLVRDADGYTSWSPAEAFEQGYKLIDTDPQPGVEEVAAPGKGFDVALKALKAGFKIARTGWNGSGMHIELQTPDANSKMTQPYAYMVIPECEEGTRRLPYVATTIDLFATDWVITK